MKSLLVMVGTVVTVVTVASVVLEDLAVSEVLLIKSQPFALAMVATVATVASVATVAVAAVAPVETVLPSTSKGLLQIHNG